MTPCKYRTIPAFSGNTVYIEHWIDQILHIELNSKKGEIVFSLMDSMESFKTKNKERE